MIDFRVWLNNDCYPYKDGQQAKEKEEFLAKIQETFSELWDKKIIGDGNLIDIEIYI